MYKLCLDTRIYPLTCVKTAIVDYRHIASISISEILNPNKISLDFINVKDNSIIIIDEFCNYLIELMQCQKENDDYFNFI